jgi:hypothetical protein
MPRIVRTARGDQVDFDTIIIKQQLAQAPMNIEVSRRKEFIDSKEGKVKGQVPPSSITTDLPVNSDNFISQEPTKVVETAPAASDFEIPDAPVSKNLSPIEIIPELPIRKK